MESSLSITFDDLCVRLAKFLGHNPATATTDTDIVACVESGYREFINPPPTDDNPSPHDWSFLHPFKSMTLNEGEQILALPDDFGGFEGQVIISSGDSSGYEILLQNEGQVLLRYAELPGSSGIPQIAALRHLRGTSAEKGQRAELVFFPEANGEYTVQFQYYLAPNALTTARPYPYGGMEHSETILSACKAAAERDLDNIFNGPQKMHFMERLKASIGSDRRHKPQYLGKNLNRESWPYRRNRLPNTITIAGVDPNI